MYVLCSVTDIILDISILCLPAFFIRNLQISRGKKIGLAAIFGLGILYVPFFPAIPNRKSNLNPAVSFPQYRV